MIQLTLTPRMTTEQVVETSATVDNNNPIQYYLHPDDETQPTFEMTPGFKPFTVLHIHCVVNNFSAHIIYSWGGGGNLLSDLYNKTSMQE